jgi:general secretion pathway protein A
MLGQVLSELTEDGTFSLMRQPGKSHGTSQMQAREAQQPANLVIAESAETAEIADVAQVEAALAQRDAQIVELQQAVLELANATENHAQNVAQSAAASSASEDIHALNERLVALESRMLEQDRTIRHTLTMLIEWIEAGDTQRVAA